MNKLTAKIAGGVVSVSLFAFGVVGSAFADTSVWVAGNGAFSDNWVKVNNEKKLDVRQTNNTHISNHVNTYQNTGKNTASFNTGGHVGIFTGDANASTHILNVAGFNFLHLGGW